MLDVDSTIVIAHGGKEAAAPTYQHTYGRDPILVTCDNTGELLAIKLRPGSVHRRRLRAGLGLGAVTGLVLFLQRRRSTPTAASATARRSPN